MTIKTKLAILNFIAVSPIIIAFAFFCYALVTAEEYSRKYSFDIASKYALAYESAVDKEKYLEIIYDDIKKVDESCLPPDLMSFVIKVKVSQFCK